MSYKVIETPIGVVGLSWEGGDLGGVDLEPSKADENGDSLPSAIAEQLDAYFQDGRKGFDLDLDLTGTSFQHRVWAALREIPPGQTITYGELAKRLGTGARAVGGACRANPCPIVVPCHRVLATNGLGGFAGDISGRKLEVKRSLLRHEGVRIPEASWNP